MHLRLPWLTLGRLQDLKTVEVEEPDGWVHIPLSEEPGYGLRLSSHCPQVR
jgi:hypothetical protein